MLSNTLTITSGNTATSMQRWGSVFPASYNVPFDLSTLLNITTSICFPKKQHSEAYQVMLASEDILRRDWEQPEEDAAWANL